MRIRKLPHPFRTFGCPAFQYLEMIIREELLGEKPTSPFSEFGDVAEWPHRVGDDMRAFVTHFHDALRD